MNKPTDTQKPQDEGGVALSPIVRLESIDTKELRCTDDVANLLKKHGLYMAVITFSSDACHQNKEVMLLEKGDVLATAISAFLFPPNTTA